MPKKAAPTRREVLALSSKRPNILLLFTDQQRWDTIAAAGNSVIKTPALDSLCARGVRFARAYTPSPVCVAARCSVMTGRLPHRSGCFNNGSPMSRELPTLMGALSEAGYQTHAVGKMHFSPTRYPFGLQSMELSEEIPQSVDADEFLQFLKERGFDEDRIFQEARWTGPWPRVPGYGRA